MSTEGQLSLETILLKKHSGFIFKDPILRELHNRGCSLEALQKVGVAFTPAIDLDHYTRLVDLRIQFSGSRGEDREIIKGFCEELKEACSGTRIETMPPSRETDSYYGKSYHIRAGFTEDVTDAGRTEFSNSAAKKIAEALNAIISPEFRLSTDNITIESAGRSK